jgi:CheY-like chemotaxis protein
MYVRGQGKYANAPVPDLIFLDLSLPKVSGLEVLKEIKATPELRHMIAEFCRDIKRARRARSGGFGKRD